MRTVIIYHPKQEFAGVVDGFKRDFEARFPDKKVQLASLETVEGSELAALYDVVRYPAILVIAENGGLQKLWQDRPFPLMDEVAAYSQTSV